MTDIRNLQAFALYMQKTDIKFDLYSVTKEIEKQVAYACPLSRLCLWLVVNLCFNCLVDHFM